MTELSDVERFDYERLKRLEAQSIDDYMKFNTAKANTPERLTAFIHQLSPWNLQRGVDAIRDYADMAIGNDAEDDVMKELSDTSEVWIETRQLLRAEQRERNK